MRVRKMTALMLAGAMTASMGTFAFADEAKELPTIDSIKLGEDYTDLTASIKVLTHRTDIVDTTFQDYIKKFNESYPNITIEYEAVTDYAEDIKLRLTTDDWGDICGIPTNLQKNELEDEFISYGDKKTLDENYVLLNNFAYNGNVYGIPSTTFKRSESYLFKDNKKSMVYISDTPKKGYVKIITSFSVLEEREQNNTSILDVQIETGRTHQIRN